MQTLPLLVLVGLSTGTKLYPGNSKLSSSDGILESKSVSERHIISIWLKRCKHEGETI